MSTEKLTTIVSAKGQVILPKAIRQARHWNAGTRLQVEDTPDGVLLKAELLFPSTKAANVFASLAHRGKAKTIEDMDKGVASEARRRYARD